jgi:hypothetical protein
MVGGHWRVPPLAGTPGRSYKKMSLDCKQRDKTRCFTPFRTTKWLGAVLSTGIELTNALCRMQGKFN